LLALRDRDSDERTECLEGFSEHWQRDPLVMDKYFALLASSQIPCTLDHVREALNHPAFSLKNPNKARALIGSFGRNMLLFHAADGSGYRFIADQVLVIDRFNPQVASRLVQLFNRWKKLEPLRRALMKAELERLAASELSKDVYEIVSKNLNQNQD
jgi:aminopeptidase N